MAFAALPALAAAASRIEARTIASKQFANNKIGMGAERAISVYLPAGYDGGQQRYPVIYMLPNLFDTDKSLFATYGAQRSSMPPSPKA